MPGLLAAAALMIDYILTAAVGISAGVEAVVSDQPWLHPHILALCLFILAVLALINMRGTKESGAAFIVPTTMFVGFLLAAIFVGVYQGHARRRTSDAGGRDAAAAAADRQLSGLVAAAEGVLQRLRRDDGR